MEPWGLLPRAASSLCPPLSLHILVQHSLATISGVAHAGPCQATLPVSLGSVHGMLTLQVYRVHELWRHGHLLDFEGCLGEPGGPVRELSLR